MAKKTPVDDEPDFAAVYAGLSDEDLLNVLKRRSHYRPEAVEVAIREAIERGMIHSEQDLFDERFQEEKVHFSWFPVPHNAKSRKMVKRSIVRSLVLTGLIPLVYGAYQFYLGKDEFAESAGIFGVLWIVLAFLLGRWRTESIVVALAAADILAGTFLIKYLIESGSPVIEFFIVIALMLMVLYGLIFYYLIDKKERGV